nr:MAG TPA: hypothetical protein [Inoviridae sp.]
MKLRYKNAHNLNRNIPHYPRIITLSVMQKITEKHSLKFLMM